MSSCQDAPALISQISSDSSCTLRIRHAYSADGTAIGSLLKTYALMHLISVVNYTIPQLVSAGALFFLLLAVPDKWPTYGLQVAAGITTYR